MQVLCGFDRWVGKQVTRYLPPNESPSRMVSYFDIELRGTYDHETSTYISIKKSQDGKNGLLMGMLEDLDSLLNW